MGFCNFHNDLRSFLNYLYHDMENNVTRNMPFDGLVIRVLCTMLLFRNITSNARHQHYPSVMYGMKLYAMLKGNRVRKIDCQRSHM